MDEVELPEITDKMKKPDEVTVSGDGKSVEIDGRVHAIHSTVSGAIRQMSDRRPLPRSNGIFQHPNDWTKEEMDYIADCLKNNIPLHVIAGMVRCERHTLSRLIERTPELKLLQEQKYINMLQTAEFQADRLMQAGNASMVMYVLDHLGRNHGWGEPDEDGGGGDGGGRIIMGCIPDEEVEKAEEQIRAVKEKDEKEKGIMSAPNPMMMAMVEDAAKAAAKEAVEEAIPEAIEAEDVSVEPPPYGFTEPQQPPSGFDSMGFGMMRSQADADPWADGANSPFYQ